MSARPQHPDDEPLARHASWIRELARTLVGDAALAEDLVQETWVAALAARPASDRPLKPWLATVLRNFARRTGRSRERTALSDVESQPTSDLPGPEELAAQLESERLLTEALAELDEPYRSTLMLRYYTSLEPSEIARRQGMPAGTVRWRVKRGLELLRKRLDDDCGGDRRTWCLLFLPLARPEGGLAATGVAASSAAITGIMAMSGILKAGAALAAVVLAVVGLGLAGLLPPSLAFWQDGGQEVEVAYRPIVPAPEASGVEIEAPAAPPAVGRREFATPTEVAPEAAVVAVAPAAVEAILVDTSGNALAGAHLREVTVDGPGRSATADARGFVRLEFEVSGKGSARYFEAWERGFTSHSEQAAVVPGETAHLGKIELSPGGMVSGRVLDPDGRGVADALVHTCASGLDWQNLELLRFGVRKIMIPATRTAADGEFTLVGLDEGPVRVMAHADGMLPAYTERVEVLDGRDSYGVEVVVRPISDENRLRGIVLDPDGEPVPRAALEVFYRSAELGLGVGDNFEAEEDGTFEFVVAADTRFTITAGDPGGRYGVATATDARTGGERIVLELTRGRDVEVVVRGGGGELLDEFEFEVLAAEPSSWDQPTILQSVRHDAERDGPAVFRLPEQSFLVRVGAPLHERAELGPFDPRDELGTLAIELDAVPGLHGVVLLNGAGVEGARISLHRVLRPKEYLVVNGFRVTRERSPAAEARTDEQGRFLLTAREAGRFLVRAAKPGHAPAESEPFTIGATLQAPTLELSLVPGGAIEGRVHAALGREATGTVVGITRGDGHACTQRVGPDGTYRFEGLMPGRWRVEDRKEEVAPGRTTVTTSVEHELRSSFEEEVELNCVVHSGETTFYDLRLRDAKAYVLRGRIRVVDVENAAWSARLCPKGRYFLEMDEAWPRGTVDSEGRFELTASEPGEHDLVLTGGSDMQFEHVFVERVDLRASVTEWELELPTGTLLVSGAEDLVVDDIPSILYLAEVRPGGLFLSLVVAGEDGLARLTVPAGAGRLARPSMDTMDPLEWASALEFVVSKGEETRVELP